MTRQTFEAQAFHPDLGNEVVNGEIFFVGWTLHFRSGEVAFAIPFDRLASEVAVGDGRIFFTDPDQPELKITTAGEPLLKYRALPQVERIYQQLSARLTRGELSRRLKMVLGAFGACALLAWLGIAATGLMIRSIVARIPPALEIQMCNSLIAELEAQSNFIEDTNYLGALSALADPLLRTLPPGPTNYTFHVAEDEEPNAHALPGGHIIVNTGLLNLTDRPEELLGVIAHEVAHVTQKHHFRKVVASGGPFLIFEMFVQGRNGALGALAGISALVVGQGFSQEFETEADDTGWQYLVKANIDPRGMAGMFAKLKAYESMQKAMKVPQAFRSHPALEKRIKRLEGKWRKLPRKSGFLDLASKENPPQ